MRYKSCTHIENSLNFGDKSLTFCCSGNKGRPVLFAYHGEGYPAGRIEEKRRELILQLADDTCPLCHGCPELQFRDWPERDGRLKTLVLNHFRECTLDCCYCGIGSAQNQKTWRQRTDKYRFLPVLEEIRRQDLLDPQAVFHWGGGEPTITKDFKEIVTILMDLRLRQLINTNATVYSPALEEALRRGLVTCQVSIDSGTPETYARIKGRNLHDKVWRHVRQYAVGGTDLIVKYILMDGNNTEGEVTAFVRNCVDGGVKSIHIAANDRDLQADAISGQTLKAAALLQVLAQRAGIRATVMAGYFQKYTSHVHALAASLARAMAEGKTVKLPMA